jgi:hypothetical protein
MDEDMEMFRLTSAYPVFLRAKPGGILAGAADTKRRTI